MLIMNKGEKGRREWREERETDIERPVILALVLVLVLSPRSLDLPSWFLQFFFSFLSYSSIYPMQPCGGGRF